MTEVQHEKANELYKRIKNLEAKIRSIETASQVQFNQARGGYTQLSPPEHEELIKLLKEYALTILRKELTELKIEYHNL